MPHVSRIVATLVLAGSTAMGWAQELPPPDDPSRGSAAGGRPYGDDDREGGEVAAGRGDGLCLRRRRRYFNSRLYMIQNADGVHNAPLPAVEHGPAAPPHRGQRGVHLSQKIVDEIAASEQHGQLTPTLQAIAEPLDEELDPLDLIGDPRGSTALRLFGTCKDKVVNKTKSFNVPTPLTRDFNIGDGFTGNLSLTGNAQVTGTGEIQVRLHRYAVFGVCIPIGVRFDHVRAYGNATANSGPR